MGVRLYDPNLSRFLQTDPVEGGCSNDYAYVHGDPVNSMDLAGLAACDGFRAYVKAGHAALTLTLVSSRTVGDRTIKRYSIHFTPDTGYANRMTRGRLTIQGRNTKSSRHKWGKLGRADTSDHPYPGGIRGVHTTFDAFEGDSLTLYGQIDWKSGTVNAGRIGPLSWSTPYTRYDGTCTA